MVQRHDRTDERRIPATGRHRDGSRQEAVTVSGVADWRESAVLVGEPRHHSNGACFRRRRHCTAAVPRRGMGRDEAGLQCSDAGRIGCLLALALVAPVLKPDLHLGLAELQAGRQPTPVDAGQVAAGGERRLQFEHLTPTEHRPRLLLPVADDVVTGQSSAVGGRRPSGVVDSRRVVVICMPRNSVTSAH